MRTPLLAIATSLLLLFSLAPTPAKADGSDFLDLCSKRDDGKYYCSSLRPIEGADPAVDTHRSSTSSMPNENNWNTKACADKRGAPDRVLTDHFNLCAFMYVYSAVFDSNEIVVGGATHVVRINVTTDGTRAVDISHTVTRVNEWGAAKAAQYGWTMKLNGPKEGDLPTVKRYGPAAEHRYTYKPTLATGAQGTISGIYMAGVKIGAFTTNAVFFDSPRFARCDNKMGKVKTQGCVAMGHAELRINDRNKEYHRHVRTAIAAGHPSRLTRLTDPKAIRKNRNTACPTDGSLPRPKGHECDEYPFASTYQGGRLPVVTQAIPSCQMKDPRSTGQGTSRCFIPRESNNNGGNELKSMYSKQRVLEKDEFVVYV